MTDTDTTTLPPTAPPPNNEESGGNQTQNSPHNGGSSLPPAGETRHENNADHGVRAGEKLRESVDTVQGWGDMLKSSKEFEEKTKESDDIAKGWEELLKFSNGFDEKMLKDWQDELANLLTFTGLLSSVVTGFVALSITMMQQDTGQRAVDLLAQISQQMSSFNIANTMVNSTLQPSFTTPRFIPSNAVVDINVLWISSLTLSLMAAFWTIAVQQWLRHIPLPQELGVRESIRLRQLRRNGILTWQVPVIVSVLPLVVQISVLLFLFGLRRLLQELDHFVATVFTVIGAILFLILVVALLLPLVFPGCPYKSPLLPTLWAPFQKTIFPVIYALLCIALRLSAAGYVGCYILLSRPVSKVLDFQVSNITPSLLYHSRVDLWATYLHQILTVDASPLVFWRLLEQWYMRNQVRYGNDVLDHSALSHVPIVVPDSKQNTILPCLKSLTDRAANGPLGPPEAARMTAATAWVCYDLGIQKSELEGRYPHIFRPNHLQKLDRLALVRLRPVLINALPGAWTSLGSTSKPAHQLQLGGPELGILSLLYWSSVGQSDTDAYTSSHTIPILGRIQEIQFSIDERAKDTVKKAQASLWLPVTLLFKYYQSENAVLSPNYKEALSVSEPIISALMSEYSTAKQVAILVTALPGGLAAIATTLHAAAIRLPHLTLDSDSKDPSPKQVPRIVEVLDNITKVLSSHHSAISTALAMCQILKNMQLDGQELYLVHNCAISSIVTSLKTLAHLNSKSLRKSSRGVAEQLRRICRSCGGYAYEIPILEALAQVPVTVDPAHPHPTT